jgi:hypothetical protein
MQTMASNWRVLAPAKTAPIQSRVLSGLRLTFDAVFEGV